MEERYLPEGFEWCRKAKYNVQVELACYQLMDNMKPLEGFEEQEFAVAGERRRYAVKSGFNILEQNAWVASPDRPFVITGTVGERWPVKPSNMGSYDVDVSKIGIIPMTISTNDPSNQEFLVAFYIPEGMEVKVIPSWAYQADGSIDESQIMIANSAFSKISHNGGDYVVAKHIPGQPEYMQIPESQRTADIARLYEPRIINGSIMQTTYDHASTQKEIIEKHRDFLLKK